MFVDIIMGALHMLITILQVNRIRELPQNNKIVATHTDSPDVSFSAIVVYVSIFLDSTSAKVPGHCD